MKGGPPNSRTVLVAIFNCLLACSRPQKVVTAAPLHKTIGEDFPSDVDTTAALCSKALTPHTSRHQMPGNHSGKTSNYHSVTYSPAWDFVGIQKEGIDSTKKFKSGLALCFHELYGHRSRSQGKCPVVEATPSFSHPVVLSAASAAGRVQAVPMACVCGPAARVRSQPDVSHEDHRGPLVAVV